MYAHCTRIQLGQDIKKKWFDRIYFLKHIPEFSKFPTKLAFEGVKTGRGCGYLDFQSLPLHINICSSSKDNSTQGTKSCQNKTIKMDAAQYSYFN